jgi:hypothetical protein
VKSGRPQDALNHGKRISSYRTTALAADVSEP